MFRLLFAKKARKQTARADDEGERETPIDSDSLRQSLDKTDAVPVGGMPAEIPPVPRGIKSPEKKARTINIIKVVLLALICVALMKLAFFPSHHSDSAVPYGEYEPPTVTASKGDVVNTIDVKAAIAQLPSKPVKSTLTGEINTLYVKNGAVVKKGAPILLIRSETQREPIEHMDSEGNVYVQQRSPLIRTAQVVAPAAGVVTLNVMLHQEVTINDPIGTLQPKTFQASGTLRPEQLYRLANAPKSAQVTIKDGPAPFNCKDLKIGAQKSSSNEEPQGTHMVASCSIPTDIKVFSGLTATLTIEAGKAKGAILLPVSAVEGRYKEGHVFIAGDDPHNPTVKDVKLGISDGESVQIIEGLHEGDEVLMYAPGQNEDEDNPEMMGG